ncbi:MAG: nuclear transport factor 2 family protein [Candidatus Acidiferrales bacterium]
MTRILVAMLFTFLVAGPLQAQSSAENTSNAEVEKEVLQVEHQRDQALLHRDMAVLDSIQDDDLTFVNGRGMVLTKAQYMDEIRSGRIKFITFEQGDYRFHIFGDTVVFTARNTGAVEVHGKIERTPRRFTMVYVKEHGQWKFAAFQATSIAGH